MAKLKGPLFSLGASQQLGKTLVYFTWKGLNVVREYVIPSNPRTALQTTQRGYMTDAVTVIHAAQGHATKPLTALDVSGYALWGSIYATPRTWFNQLVKNFLDQRVASKAGIVYTQTFSNPGVDALNVSLYTPGDMPTAGTVYYGTSKTALINSKAATIVGKDITCLITGLTTGVKYFWQFRPSAAANKVGAYSGIYYGVPA